MTDVGLITVTVNDVERSLPQGATCRDLLVLETGRTIGADGRAESGEGLGVALARDGVVLPRGAWAYTHLVEGDRFDLVTAVPAG